MTLFVRILAIIATIVLFAVCTAWVWAAADRNVNQPYDVLVYSESTNELLQHFRAESKPICYRGRMWSFDTWGGEEVRISGGRVVVYRHGAVPTPEVGSEGL